jgi:hypothetical protein
MTVEVIRIKVKGAIQEHYRPCLPNSEPRNKLEAVEKETVG